AGVLIGPVVNGSERRASTVIRRFLQAASKETPASAWPSIRAYLSCGPRWFIDTFPAMLAYPLEERIAEVRTDLALIAGEYDRLAPAAWLEVLRGLAPGERVTVDIVPNASHQVMVTHPERVVEICLDIGGLA
ncbi:MAG TPA: alpha/beta hydrolase, partial [Arachnia sp.]|nr:alpha/beta hydrolase [Arachnia sp.]